MALRLEDTLRNFAMIEFPRDEDGLQYYATKYALTQYVDPGSESRPAVIVHEIVLGKLNSIALRNRERLVISLGLIVTLLNMLIVLFEL